MKKLIVVILLCILVALMAGCDAGQLAVPSQPTSPSQPEPTQPEQLCADGHAFSEETDLCNVCGMEYYAATLAFELREDGKSYALVGIGSCSRDVIRVPETYMGKPVTEIGDRALANMNFKVGDSTITEVILPDTIESIGKEAFFLCNNLRSISLPSSCLSIGSSAFSDCEKLQTVEWNEGLLSIGWAAFGGCRSLQEAILPSTVTFVDGAAFSECVSLTNIRFPDGITQLRKAVISGCASLETVRVPAGVTVIPELFAYECTSLKQVIFEGEIVEIGKSAFASCTALEVFAIPETVTHISDNAFALCTGLRNITIPEGVTCLHQNTFKGCDALQYNTYEGGLYLSVGDNPYYWLIASMHPDVKTLIIHDECKQMLERALKETDIEHITIGKSIHNISSDELSMPNLKTIQVTQGNTKYHATDNCLIETATKTLVRAGSDAVIPTDGSVKVIGSFAFAYLDGLSQVVIPNAVTQIDSGAFAYCKNLEWILIGSGVSKIGSDPLKEAKENCLVFYQGTDAQWDAIEIYGDGTGGDGYYPDLNSRLLRGVHYCYSRTEPVVEGDYWHYVDDVPTVWPRKE